MMIMKKPRIFLAHGEWFVEAWPPHERNRPQWFSATHGENVLFYAGSFAHACKIARDLAVSVFKTAFGK